MAAKKKPTKSANDNKGTKAQVAAFKKSKVKFKPTEAITAKGQKAKGLAKSKTKDRFASTAKTKVKKADSRLGSGTPLGSSLAMSKKSWRDAALEGGPWILPYGKGAKAINAGTKFIRGAKSGKAVRGTLKTVGFLGAGEVYDRSVRSVTSKKPRIRVRGK